MGSEPALVLLGQITAAHGVRGHVLIRTYTDAPGDIAAYGPLQDQSGARTFEIAVVRVTPKGIVGQIAGVADRNAAEALRGTQLLIARERLPETAAGEFYHSDLIGLPAVGPDRSPIGEIIAVHNFGAGDILEIRLKGTRTTEMVPFTRAFVPEIDIARRQVTVLLQPESGDEDADE